MLPSHMGARSVATFLFSSPRRMVSRPLTCVKCIITISIVLIPVIGLTARFVLKPFLEPLGRILEARSEGETARVLELRMALLEQQMEALETTVNRLAEVTDFNR